MHQVKRKLAIYLAWDNHSEYHSQQLAAAIQGEWDTTITYEAMDWNQFDLIMPWYAHRKVNCEQQKVIMPLWERHEFGYAQPGNTIIAPSLAVLDALRAHNFERVIHLPWGINTKDFSPAPFPELPLKIGWCGTPMDRKRDDELKDLIETIPGAEFMPNFCETRGGKTTGPYEMREMGQYYAKIHIYACASIWEGFSFPHLESSACGRPIVSFDVGISRDLEATGAGIWIVQSFDEMLAAIDEGTDYQLQGQRSKEAIDKYWSWDVMAPRWLEMLDETYEYSHG